MSNAILSNEKLAENPKVDTQLLRQYRALRKPLEPSGWKAARHDYDLVHPLEQRTIPRSAVEAQSKREITKRKNAN